MSRTTIVIVCLVVVVGLAYWPSQFDKGYSQGSQPSVATPTMTELDEALLDDAADDQQCTAVNAADEPTTSTEGQFLVEPRFGTAEFLSAREVANTILEKHRRVLRSRIVAVDEAAIETFVRVASESPSEIRFDVQFFDDVACTINEVRQFIESQSYSSKIILSGCETYRDIGVIFDPDDGHFTATLEFGTQRYTAESIGNGYALVYQIEADPFTED